MTDEAELITFVKLKYFPLGSLPLNQLPEEVQHEFTQIIVQDIRQMLSKYDSVNNYLEECLFNLLMDYHRRNGYDYNEHGDLPE